MRVEGANVASSFLASMFGASTANPVFICSLPNSDAKDREAGERKVTTRQPDHIEAFLKKWDRKDRALYFCTATLHLGATTRSKQTLAELNGLHCDIDFKSVANAGPAEIERRLRETMHLPSYVVLSGNGLHAYWLFHEGLLATPENVERIEALLRLLADHLAGDPQCAEASRLMRLPGSHNTKDGGWAEVQVLVNEPTRRYDPDELAEWLETVSPILHRKPADSGNGHDADPNNPWLAVAARFGTKPPIDVEARLAAMRYQGAGDAGIHATQVSVTAALLNRSEAVEDVIEVMLSATRAAAGQFGERWNWRREESAIRQMCASWLAKHPYIEASADQPEAETAKPKKSALHWHGDVDPAEGRAWLAQNLLPETGKGLVSGQWGVYKTFVALDLAAAVMAGASFIDFPIVGRGGVLFIAAEGSAEIAVRLQAVLESKYPQITQAPFAWTNTSPQLLGRKAISELSALAEEAAARIRQEFGLPLALIMIDTVVAAAGYSQVGEESDAAVGQAIMNVMEQVAQRSGALVLGIDHFGKSAETGTRGTSAKEGAADVVLALLGAKSISGEITNTRLAMRKRRSGPGGEEFPFTVQSVDLGVDQYGAQITSLIVQWGAKGKQEPERREHWSRSLRLLRQAMMNVLVDHGREQRPFADGPLVRAVDIEVVRQEFYRSYPAEGDATTKQAIRQKAFRRALVAAQEQNLVGVREVGTVTLVWLIRPEEAGA
jgi:RecA-family ATPase